MGLESEVEAVGVSASVWCVRGLRDRRSLGEGQRWMFLNVMHVLSGTVVWVGERVVWLGR